MGVGGRGRGRREPVWRACGSLVLVLVLVLLELVVVMLVLLAVMVVLLPV